MNDKWQVVRLSEICTLNPRKPKWDKADMQCEVSFVPMVAVDAESGTILASEKRPLSMVNKGYTYFSENDVVMAKITPCMENGKAAIAKNLVNNIGFGTTEFHVLRATENILPEWIFHFIRQETYRKQAEKNMTGSVGQKHVPIEFIANTEIPLPPLDEQRRIADKLDILLAKINKCKSRLERIPEILKRFRQSVLADACSDKLSEDWRERNNITKWSPVFLNDIAEFQSGYAYKSKRILKTGNNQVIKIANVKNNHLNLNAAPAFIDDDYASETSRFQLNQNDIVISMTGTWFKRDYGFPALVPQMRNQKLSLNQRVGRLRPNSAKILASLLLLLLQTDSFKNHFFYKETGNVNQGNVGADALRLWEFDLPDLSEQRMIMDDVNRFFSIADKIEFRYRKTIPSLPLLKQSILSKAFRGELLNNDKE